MERIFFEEKQHLPDLVLWSVVITGLTMCVPLLHGYYIRTALGQTWGEPSMTNTHLLLLVLGLVVVIGIVAWLVVVQYQQVQIDADGISVRLYPQQRKERRITRESIVDYTIRKLKWYEYMQSTQKRKISWMKEVDIVTMGGRNALVLTLAGGKKFILGTSDPDGIMWAMKKLLSKA